MGLFKKGQGAVKLNRKNYKDRKWMGILCVVLAAVLAFGVLPALYQKKSETAMAVVAVGHIYKGAAITKDQIKMQEIGTYGIKDYMTDSKEIVGEVARIEMLPGDIVTEEKIGGKSTDIITDIVNEDKRLVTVSVGSNAAGVASHITSGDTVNVYSIREDSNGAMAVGLNPALMNLEIYDVENSNTASVADQKSDADTSESVISTVTFIATEAQAAELIKAEYDGKLHIVFVRR